jgi:hypothetical protein
VLQTHLGEGFLLNSPKGTRKEVQGRGKRKQELEYLQHELDNKRQSHMTWENVSKKEDIQRF